MPRKLVGDRPLTPAEKMQRYRAERVQFRPNDPAALSAAAERAGKDVPKLVAEIVQDWLVAQSSTGKRKAKKTSKTADPAETATGA